MRSVKLGLLSGFAALVAFGAVDNAEAGSRWKYRYYDYYPDYESFYPGPIFIPPPRYYKYNRYSAYEDDYDDDYDPEYYEPQYAPPGAPKKKLKRTQPAPQVYKPSTTKKKVTTKQPQTQQAQKKPTSITCDKASKIVAGYGFSAVKPSTCQGKEYAFAATRDGASYVIKMSSASGELTQVKKQ
ncbi:MAG: hypothetical protein U1E67_03545 [Hyphomicrobiales bacterium]